MNIIKPSASMKSKPNETSSLETECLFGETIEILDEYFDWVYCRLITDNYYGWVKKGNLGRIKTATHRVINKRTFIYKEENAKSEIFLYVPLGSNLSINKVKSDWAEVLFLLNNNSKFGYVPIKHIVKINHKIMDWVSIAQQLEGTPYRWGGRDTLGIDCSALLQLSYQTYNQNIPRNTSEQVALDKEQVNDIKNLKRGCVVFWKGHTGIMIDNLNCIHANAYHMKTITEPLVDIIDRANKDLNIIKMMDFN